jgi:hypothetical protein
MCHHVSTQLNNYAVLFKDTPMPDSALEGMMASSVKLFKAFTPQSDVQAMYRCTAAAGATCCCCLLHQLVAVAVAVAPTCCTIRTIILLSLCCIST